MTFTYNTTPVEDAGIIYVVGVENARRAALTPPQPAITAAQYITQILAVAFASYKQQSGDGDIQTIKVAYQSADDAKKAAIVAAAVAAASAK